MFVLVYAPHGIVGEDGSKVVVTDTYNGAQYEMFRQMTEFIAVNDLDDGDFDIDRWHATAGLSQQSSPEWHIYEA